MAGEVQAAKGIQPETSALARFLERPYGQRLPGSVRRRGHCRCIREGQLENEQPVEAFVEKRIRARARRGGIHHGTVAADDLDFAVAQNSHCAGKLALRILHIERGATNREQSYPHVCATCRKRESERPQRFRKRLRRRDAAVISGGCIASSVAVCAMHRNRACRRECGSKRMVITNSSARKGARDGRMLESIQTEPQR